MRRLDLEDRIALSALPHNLLVSNFYQNWNSPAFIVADDDWSGVASVTGYLGDEAIGEGIDPQTILTPFSAPDVIANQGINTALTTGGVAEFDGLVNPVVALQPDGTAAAPNLVVTVNTIGRSNITVSYRLRDIDDTVDNAVQRVALQYRIGTVGNFTNVPAGFVADATAGPNLAVTVTQVNAALPSAVNNQPLVQLRIITANAVGNDEWVGIDDLLIASKDIAVNTYFVGAQLNSSVAMDANGDTFVAWESNGQDGSSYGIYGQRIDSTGTKVGGEFQVHTYTTLQQRYPSVAMDADGDVWVAWASYGADGNSYGISGQRFNAAGMKIGGEFQINTTTTNAQSLPRIALDADGDAIVVWQSYFQDGDQYGVYAQRFDSAGMKVGGEISVNTSTSGPQRLPAVAIDADGDALIVWESFAQDGSGLGVYGQRINPTGSKVGGEFRINTYTTQNQARPAVAMDAAGNSFVVWQSFGQDGNSDGIFGQRLSPSGAFVGGEFPINTYTTNFQAVPHVAMDSDGDAVVIWQSNFQDGDAYGIYAQRFDSAGLKVGAEFGVNTYLTYNQRYPGVAVDADGDAFVTWTSDEQDISSAGIFGQRFRSPNPIPNVASIQVNDGSPQRSMVTSIKITFDAAVSFVGSPAAAFSLISQKTAGPVALTAAVDGSSTAVTLTFAGAGAEFGSLTDSRYTLTAFASKFSSGFDGNGDGTPGDDYVLIGSPANGLFRLFGDADGNGSVNTVDFNSFRSAFGGISPIFDFDNSGSVGTLDFNQFRARFGSSV